MTPAINPNGSYNVSVVEGWYQNTGGVIPWAQWLMPLLAWSALILTVQWMHACLAVMLRVQWAEREALAFPLLRLPLEMTEDVDDRSERIGKFFRNPAVWIGFGIAVFIEGMNGLNKYFPDVPPIPRGLNTSQIFTEAPWNQLGQIQMSVFLAIIGITYLLTSEVSFSLWFFHLFSKFQYVVAYMIGFPPASLDSPFWTRGWAKGFIGY